jgi:hypothetical protein
VCTNIIIVDVDAGGESVSVKSKTLCPMGREGGSSGRAVMFQMEGSYVDRLKRTEGGWRIL